ncbi:hypothetical protein HDU93_005772, partial [Gonapodya sp. JEL0774]
RFSTPIPLARYNTWLSAKRDGTLVEPSPTDDIETDSAPTSSEAFLAFEAHDFATDARFQSGARAVQEGFKDADEDTRRTKEEEARGWYFN